MSMSLKLEKINNGEVYYDASFMDESAAWDFFQLLKAEINWGQEYLKMYGKVIAFPRLTAWYGDEGKSYRYSGVTRAPLPWTEALLGLRKRIEMDLGIACNSVLLNYYRDGNDSMSWHADDEVELGINPIIVSLNLGSARKFQIKHKFTGERRDFILEHGSLFIMAGEMQHFWKHQLPKTKKQVGERINLTFRFVI